MSETKKKKRGKSILERLVAALVTGWTGYLVAKGQYWRTRSSQKKKKRGIGILEGLVAVLVVGLTGYLVAMDQYRKSPFLSHFGTEEWKATCEGEGRVYRLHSTDARKSGNRHATNFRRALSFLGEDGQTLYRTGHYEHGSLERDGAWRFQYNPKDPRLAGRKDQAAVLRGDEQSFEIERELGHMVVVRKEAPSLRLPCKSRRIGELEKLRNLFDRFVPPS